MLQEITRSNDVRLYEYFRNHCKAIPYYFSVPYSDWQYSMYDDTDFDGKDLFIELMTYALVEDGAVKGFIQYGLTNFTFGEKGERDYSCQYAIIRNMHYLPDVKNPHLLMDKAIQYFNEREITERYAYFHFFGMSCYARQGKLHSSGFYIEELLKRYKFHIEHENVYYSKRLAYIDDIESNIVFLDYDNGRHVVFMKNEDEIGDCKMDAVLHTDICYLWWIGIKEGFAHQGLGRKCMKKLFSVLWKRGFTRLDTDTTDRNIAAQNYYLKTGFTDMGRMRSYNNL